MSSPVASLLAAGHETRLREFAKDIWGEAGEMGAIPDYFDIEDMESSEAHDVMYALRLAASATDGEPWASRYAELEQRWRYRLLNAIEEANPSWR